MMIKTKNEVRLFGKVISIPEFRSETTEGDELYQCLVEVPMKSFRNGMIKEIGKSYITLVYRINKTDDQSEESRQQDKAWLSLKSGEFVEVKGQLAQDRIGRLGTSSVFVRSFEILEKLDESQGNAIVTVTGEVYKESPKIKKFPNESEKLAFILNHVRDNISMKTYIVAWNNLAHKIDNLKLDSADEIEVIGNLVSRKYHNRLTNEDVNVCELLAKRVSLISRVQDKVGGCENEELQK